MKQLTLIEKAFFLKKTNLFQEVELDLLVAIADKLNQDIYDADELVFDLQHRANRMYLIAKGSVNLFDENNNLVFKLLQEDFFGDEALFNEKLRQYRAVCETQTLLLTLSKTHLFTIISECPQVAIALLKCYAQNLSYRFENKL